MYTGPIEILGLIFFVLALLGPVIAGAFLAARLAGRDRRTR